MAEPINAIPGETPRRWSFLGRRHSKWAWLAGAALLVVLAVVAGLIFFAGGPGPAPDSAIKAVPHPVDFGEQTVGTTSGIKIVIVSDRDRTRSVSVGSIQLSGTDAADFAVAATSCPNANIPAGQSCSVAVRFAPPAAGERSAVLLVHRGDGEQMLTVPLTGRGIAGALTAQESTVDFGQIEVGVPTVAKTITVTNTTGQAVVVEAISLSGDDAEDFSTTAAGCVGATIAPAGTCTVSATFDPTTFGDRDATILFSYDRPGSPLSVGLTGAGAALMFRVAPAHLQFGRQAVGSRAGLVVTMSTPLGTVVSIGAVTVTGPAAADYAVTSNGCSAVTLPPRSSCVVTVEFTPTADGTRNASMAVYRANESVAANQVQLTGLGFSAK